MTDASSPSLQAVPLHAVAQGVSRQAQPRRGARDVPSLGAQRLLDASAFERRHLLVHALARPRGDAATRGARGRRKAAAVTCSASDSSATRSIRLASSRTLPGHGYASRAASASDDRALDRQAVLAACPIEIVAREKQDVGSALAKRRQLHGHDREAMIEILAESPGANRGGQVLARRREHPRVGRLGARAAKPPDRTILERLEQLDLQRVRHQPDLVEEDRAAMSDLKQARLGLLRVGERAALESEELGLEQRVGNRRTVDVDERRRRPADPSDGSRARPAPCRFLFRPESGPAAGV